MALGKKRDTTSGSSEVGGGQRPLTQSGSTHTGTTRDGFPDVDRDGRDDRTEHHTEHVQRTEHTEHHRTDDTDHARDKFGGMNLGAGFFGWLVAIAMTILLVSILGAILTAVGSSTNITQSEAEREAGTIGLAAAIALLVILALAYYLGGYVAGRMSRFDGARQGLLVWIIGLLVTIIAIALGAIFGSEYNLLDRVNLPRLPISTSTLSTGGLITALAVLVVTLLAAVAGGKIGHHYHNRVDKAARR